MEKISILELIFPYQGIKRKKWPQLPGGWGVLEFVVSTTQNYHIFDVDSNGCSEEGNGELLSEVKGRSIQSGHMKRIFYVTEKHWNEHAILVLVLVVFLTYVSVKVKR